jgi:hypothetical protein
MVCRNSLIVSHLDGKPAAHSGGCSSVKLYLSLWCGFLNNRHRVKRGLYWARGGGTVTLVMIFL